MGRTVSQGTLDKIKANDKWVVMEILDFVEDTDKNAEDMPFEEEEIIDEIKEGDIKVSKTEDVKPVEAVAPLSAEVEKGLAIEKELALAYESGKRTITLDELRSISKTAYNVVFDTYDESGENGLETTMYDLTETDDEVFTLTKK